MTMKQGDGDEDAERAAHEAAPTGRGRERRADLGVERDELLDVRRLVGALAEPRDGGREQARDPVEAERAVEEAGDGDVVGGDQRGRGALADPARLAGDPERREAVLVRRAEVEAPGRDRSTAADGEGRRSG